MDPLSEKLCDISVDSSHPFFNVRHTRRYFFEHMLRPAPGLPLVVRREKLDSGRDLGRHQLVDYYSLWVIRGGRGIHTVNGHPYSVRRGDVYIMPAGGVHGYRDYENVEGDAFYFQAELFSVAEMEALQELAGFWDLFVPAPPRRTALFRDRRLHLSPEQYREVEGIIDAIRAEICSPSSIGPIMARYRFYCLLGVLARWHNAGGKNRRTNAAGERKRRTPENGDRNPATMFHVASLAEVVQYCDEHFSQGLTVAQLAARMCLSQSHFAKLFTAQVGIPPLRYLRSLRLENAQALLRDTEFTVTEIATHSGFGDLEHLAHAFKQEFGATPSGYRKTFRAASATEVQGPPLQSRRPPK